MRMIRIFGLTILIVMLMNLSAYSEEWLGMFNMDRYPLDGCKVVRVDNNGTMYYGRSFRRAEGAGKDSFMAVIDNDMENSRKELIDYALKKGFNAVLGVRIIIEQSINHFGGSIINGDMGIGWALVRVEGTPVKIECK